LCRLRSICQRNVGNTPPLLLLLLLDGVDGERIVLSDGGLLWFELFVQHRQV
jgi:hypothetical protein